MTLKADHNSAKKRLPEMLFFKDCCLVAAINQVLLQGAAAYQLGNTSSRTITEVKQR